jgi:hypothetical protein
MMSTKWQIAGEEVVSCNCVWGCPCQFNALPTHDRCEAVAAWEIHDGYFGDTRLDGMRRFVRVYSWPGAVHHGNGTRLNIIDEEASAEQRAALLALESGTHGGLYFEIYASVCPKVLGPIFAPITIEVDRERRRGRVVIPDILEAYIEPIRNSVTGEEHRAKIVLPGGFEYEEAENANTVRFEVKPHAVAMRHANTYAQLNAFDWSN